jgi:hypothetical protein
MGVTGMRKVDKSPQQGDETSLNPQNIRGLPCQMLAAIYR